jgi:hypothetical protein
LPERLQSLRVTVSTLNVSAGGLNTDQKDFAVRFIEAAIDLAAPGMLCHHHPYREKVSDPALWRKMPLFRYRRSASLPDAGSAGIQLTLKLLAGSLTETVAETTTILRCFKRSREGIHSTPAILRGQIRACRQCIAEIGAQIGHVHFGIALERTTT